jgi:hypothetical protein
MSEDKMKNKVLSQAGIWFLGTLTGALIAGLVGLAMDYLKDKQTRKELTEIIRIDIQDTKKSIDEFVCAYPLEKTLEQNKNSEVFIDTTIYDTYIFDAYLQKISLLPIKNVQTILSFYKNLKKANEASFILRDRDLNLPWNKKETWLRFFYQSITKAVRDAKIILEDSEGQHANIELISDANRPNDIIDINEYSSILDSITVATSTITTVPRPVMPVDGNSKSPEVNEILANP